MYPQLETSVSREIGYKLQQCCSIKSISPNSHQELKSDMTGAVSHFSHQNGHSNQEVPQIGPVISIVGVTPTHWLRRSHDLVLSILTTCSDCNIYSVLCVHSTCLHLFLK